MKQVVPLEASHSTQIYWNYTKVIKYGDESIKS
jgi:hypothetical protein